MIGPTYTINLWGKWSYVLDAALIICWFTMFYMYVTPFTKAVDSILTVVYNIHTYGWGVIFR